MGGFYMVNQGWLGSLSAYLPFAYLQPTAVVDGSMMIKSGAPNVGLLLGSLILILFTLLKFFASIRIVQNRELL